MTHLRAGRPDDLPRLRAIQSAALAESSPALLDAAAEGPLSLFVVADDEPVGYALVVTDGASVAYVPELAVAPDRQGRGHGSKLLTHLVAERRAEGYDELRLTARVDDDRLRRFYTDHGFEPRRRVPDFFESGDGRLFVREL